MNGAGLAVALGVAIATGLLLGLFPHWDIAIARRFFQPGAGFAFLEVGALRYIRDAGMLFVAIMVLPAVVALVLKIARPSKRMLVPARTAVFLVSTLLLGPLLIVNAGFKDHWSRPRPYQVTEFGGAHPFKPWWDPRGACPGNCSFVSGETAGAAWTFAPAALAPPSWRALAYAGAFGLTATVGALRVAFGGHFLSDVLLAAALMFIVIWIVHGFLYRWRGPPTDAAVEALLVRIGEALRAPFRRAPRADAPTPYDSASPRPESYSSLQKGPP